MSTFDKWAVWSTSTLTALTGFLYWWMQDWLQPLDEFAVINHPLQPWVLKAHVLAAPLMVFAIGLVAAEHIWRQYRLRIKAGRRSGLLAMWALAPMIGTGYLIQVVTHIGWLEALAWAHLAAGSAYLVGLLLHHPLPRRFVHPLLVRRRPRS
ncbi:MAG: hypothetical protein ABL963_10505 [Longimicrobiales bacterium]